MKKLFIAATLFFSLQATAQVGIGTATPAASAQLEVNSTNKGFLPPRVPLVDINDASTIASPAAGLVVYNTATSGTSPNNVVPGLYVWNDSIWVFLKKDDLGNHTATQNLKMNDNWISNDGDNEGIYIKTDGSVGIGTNTPGYLLDVNGTMKVATTPSITNATKVLARDTATKQVSEQEVTTKASGIVNAGVAVTLDNIQARVTTSGTRSIELATVSGTISLSGTSTNVFVSAAAGSGGANATVSGYMRQSDTFTTTFVRWQPSADFPYHGSVQTIVFKDETNDRSYRITMVVGYGYAANVISIERIA
jgi:hypothetical protein